jgi:Zn-dependent protease
MRPRTVGQFQGIDVRVHPSMVLVLLWAVYHWGYSARGGLTAVTYGLVFVVALFGLVVLHELGHGLMARQFGLRVRDVTLLPFGGVAHIEQMPASPRTEAMVALAGPLTNVAIAVASLPLLVLWFLLKGYTSLNSLTTLRLDDPSFTGFVVFLFLANLMLAIVNLLPAFPMDGGRVFRAAMSSVVGRDLATKAAVYTGIVFSVVIGSVALANGNLIIPVISVFLVAAAFAEGRAVRIEQQMRRLYVGQFAVWDRGGINPSEPLALAVRDGPRDIAVTSHGAVLGMIWKADLQRALQNGGLSKKAGEIMDANIVTADIGTSVFDVHTLMSHHNQWALPITEHGVYRGMFSGERLTHVHQYLRSRTPENRHVSAFTGSLSQTLRAWVR